MKALRFNQFGDPSQVLQVEEIPTPHSDRSDEAVIEIAVAGINPSDVKNVQGAMHDSSVPRTPGRDFSGTVIDGPSRWLGREVWGSGGDIGFTIDGTHAQYIKLPIDALTIKPDALTHEEAATSALTFVTAYLCYRAVTSSSLAGRIVLVIGAAGGVGNAAMQICKVRGVDVVGLVRKQTDADKLAKLGFDAFATDVVDPKQGLEKFGRRGADLIIDTVGGTSFNMAFSVLNQRGRIAEIASPANMRVVSFDMIDFYHREATLIGIDSRNYSVQECAVLLTEMTDVFKNGISRSQSVLPVSLAEAIDAYARIAAGQSKNRFAVYSK